MELYKRDFFIARIRSGYIPIKVGGKRLVVYHPSKEVILRANEIYVEEYERGLEAELLDDDDVYQLLILNNLWTESKEKELEKIVPGHIEHWKIELYQNVLKTNTRITIRKYLEAAKIEYGRLYNTRHSLDHMTGAGYASYVKNMYIITQCARHKNKRVDWTHFDINNVMNTYHGSLLDSDTLRMLSREQPWSSLWPVLKTNGRIFENTNLTTEQQSLISWSTMYDKIYESPDCPPEEVLEDDDMLDGWLLIQKRQRDTDKKKHELESSLGKKIGNADDIFLIAETPEDAVKIDLLNDERAKRVKRQRFGEIQEKGSVAEQQLSDVKLKQNMQFRQAYVNQVKGR
jgi:hypothetical protein